MCFVSASETLRPSKDRRNRILDWAEILMGLEDNSIEFRLEVPESDRYIGNPEDYVDAAGYEALLQTLAESDNAGRRGLHRRPKTPYLSYRRSKLRRRMRP
ncbi:COP1-interacting protein 8 [Prunus dulcis]|uniref:COP1-interacting protein 8 n=1 Tax=Prunus dulcis TaxID=3755 RepID=A0A4Y1QSL5_PRUDU|nr:COP1-interacting protein 8 [Prunus dulcis]